MDLFSELSYKRITSIANYIKTKGTARNRKGIIDFFNKSIENSCI